MQIFCPVDTAIQEKWTKDVQIAVQQTYAIVLILAHLPAKYLIISFFTWIVLEYVICRDSIVHCLIPTTQELWTWLVWTQGWYVTASPLLNRKLGSKYMILQTRHRSCLTLIDDDLCCYCRTEQACEFDHYSGQVRCSDGQTVYVSINLSAIVETHHLMFSLTCHISMC